MGETEKTNTPYYTEDTFCGLGWCGFASKNMLLEKVMENHVNMG